MVFYSDEAMSQITAIMCQEESFLEQPPTVCEHTECPSSCCSAVMQGQSVQLSPFQCQLCPPAPGTKALGKLPGAPAWVPQFPWDFNLVQNVAPHIFNYLSHCWHSLLCLLTSPKVELERTRVSFSLRIFELTFYLLFLCLSFLIKKRNKTQRKSAIASLPFFVLQNVHILLECDQTRFYFFSCALLVLQIWADFNFF